MIWVMNNLSEKHDNRVDWRLSNWGRVVNADWQDGPRRNPKSQAWQDQVTQSYVDEGLPLPEPDRADAEEVHQAMIRCMKTDMDTARVLTRHYRDYWYSGERHNKMLAALRFRFWRWL